MNLHRGSTEDDQIGIPWKYDEDRIIWELWDYCASTYGEHYGANEIQASEFISSSGHGDGFFLGNVIKYADRYSKKGKTPAEWRKDLLKIAHYTIMQIWEHDSRYGNES